MIPSSGAGLRLSRALLRLAVVAGTAVALAPSAVAAQEGCTFGDQGNDVVDTRVLPGIGRVTYVSNPHFICDRGVQIFADSAVAYGDRGMSHLMGDVRYLEDGRELRAQEARYFSNEGRLQAQRDVLVVDEEQGSRIEDGDLVYLVATEFRETAEMTVTTEADGTRPRALLTPPQDSVEASTPADSTATPEPYTVLADRIFLRGSGYFSASGDVEIVRDSLFAYADSAEYDQEGDGLVLEGGARVEGTSYELTGRTITMSEPGGAESNVRALREARLTGEDLLLTSAQILVVLRDGDLHRLVATPLARSPAARRGPAPQPTPRPGVAEEAPDSVDLERPEALVQDFVLTSDSLEVNAPGERIQRVFAAGSARSVSTARDSLNAEVLPEVARNDWLEGDTVVIRFPGSPPVPPLRVPDADTLVADTLVDETAVVTGDSLAPGDTLIAPGDTVAPEGAMALGDTIAPGDTVAPADAVASVDTLPGDRDLEPGLLAPEATGDDPDENEPEEIIARGRARSLYRLPPNDSTFRAGTDAPAVHYVVGDEIRIRLDSGEVDEMRVTGQTRGVHLEPLTRRSADSTEVADSLVVPTDTGSATVDTLSAQPDTGTASMERGTGSVSVSARPRSGPPRNRSNVSQQAEGHAHPPKDPSWIRR